MSLALAADPGYTPKPCEPCAAKGCRNRPSSTVRACLGSRHPSTVRVCSEHHALLEEAGALEKPMPPSVCVVPRCTNPRAQRGLCKEHAAQVTRWPDGKSPVSSAFAMSLATPLDIDPTRVPLGELVGQADPPATTGDQDRAAREADRRLSDEVGPSWLGQPPAAKVAPVEPERVPVVPLVVSPTTAPAMPHLTSVRLGMDRAADAMTRALRGEAWSPDDLSAGLVEVLRVLDRAHDKAHLRGTKDGHLRAAQAIQDLLAGQGHDLTPLLPELQAALAKLSLHLHEEHTARAAVIDALNLGAPHAGHVSPETPHDEVVNIIRARTVALHEERQQRVALAERVRELEAQRPPEPIWTRYRLSLCGHVALGEVEARRVEGGGLELRDGTLIGPAAIFQAIPVVPPPPLPEPEVGMRVRFGRKVVEIVALYGSEGPSGVILFDDDSWVRRQGWGRPAVEWVESATENTTDPNSLPY